MKQPDMTLPQPTPTPAPTEEQKIERACPALTFLARQGDERLDDAEHQLAALLFDFEEGVAKHAKEGGDFAPTGTLRRKILEAFRGEHRRAQTPRTPAAQPRAGFRITSGKGFHITFANGYTVSVQFGPGNYCANRNDAFPSLDDLWAERKSASGEKGSHDAEVAVWAADGDLIQRDGWDDTVNGWQSPNDVLALLNWAASQPSCAALKSATARAASGAVPRPTELQDRCCRVTLLHGHVTVEVLVDNAVDLTLKQDRTKMFRKADTPMVHSEAPAHE